MKSLTQWVKPILAMPGFWKILLQLSLPKWDWMGLKISGWGYSKSTFGANKQTNNAADIRFSNEPTNDIDVTQWILRWCSSSSASWRVSHLPLGTSTHKYKKYKCKCCKKSKKQTKANWIIFSEYVNYSHILATVLLNFCLQKILMPKKSRYK